MSCPRRVIRLSLAVSFLLIAGRSSVSASGDEWKAIDPAQLALKTSVVEKDADAEDIFWEIRVEDENGVGGPRTVLSHYVRMKIFNDRGRERYSRDNHTITLKQIGTSVSQ
jgi:hypothetical protein